MIKQDELLDFPFPPGPLSGVPAEYAERRTTCLFGKVKLRSGDEAVLLVTQADAAAAMADNRLSHDLTAPAAPRLAPGMSYRDDPEIILNLEGDKHRRFRRIMAAAFTPRNITRFSPEIRDIADELVDRIQRTGTSADLVEGYINTLPILVISKLLGLSEDDLPRLQRWSDAFALATPITDQERADQLAEFGRYITELITARKAEPGTSLIDDLITARDGVDSLSEEELPYLVMALIVGGSHTTSNVLGRSVLSLLLDDGALWRRLVAEPETIPAAVDEMLRFHAMGDLLQLRVATEDVELPSGTVRSGEAVVVAVRAGLTDETAYREPETVRFDREAGPPLYFGGGAHFCIGAHLAKAELRIGLGVLAERLPGLRLDADLDAVRFTEGAELSSLLSLPVAW